MVTRCNAWSQTLLLAAQSAQRHLIDHPLFAENGLYGYGADSGSGTFFENTIVVQYDPQVQEVWDQARKLRCTWHDQYEKSVTFRSVAEYICPQARIMTNLTLAQAIPRGHA